MRQLSILDNILCQVDTALRTLMVPQHRASRRHSPAEGMAEPLLNDVDRRHAAGLMRVNHAGEVSAQALYQGQALTAQLATVKAQMTEAALEEVEHLAWCEKRLRELDSKPSLLNPLWYFGSLLLGAVAGMAGDRWSLGFVAETERQVAAHLERHWHKLPTEDKKSKAIVKTMQSDEAHHADMAKAAGAAPLPSFIKQVMQVMSRALTQFSYYI